MSRSALERQSFRGRRGDPPIGATPMGVYELSEKLAEERDQKPDEVKVHGNTRTYNLNPLLAQNVLSSGYFHSLVDMDFDEVVDEIYLRIEHVGPWSAGTSRVPSSAFCCLMKLFVMRCTRRQMHQLLRHPDSPYIRALGFLYLRYTINPKELWKWFEPYVEDEEEFSPGPGSPKITMSKYVQSLIKDMHYYGTMLPRIPVPIERKMLVQLLLLEEKRKRARENEPLIHLLTVGAKVRAIYGDEDNDPAWYEAVVESVDEDMGNYWVNFPEYGNSECVSLGEIQITSSRDRSGGDYDRSRGSHHRRSRSRSDSRDRNREGRGGGDGRGLESVLDMDSKVLYNKVLERDRQRVAAVGKDYAVRPTSYKGSLSLKQDRYTTRHKSRSRSPDRSAMYRRRKRVPSRSPSPLSQHRARERDSVRLVTAEGLKKKKMLQSRYGNASAKK